MKTAVRFVAKLIGRVVKVVVFAVQLSAAIFALLALGVFFLSLFTYEQFRCGKEAALGLLGVK